MKITKKQVSLGVLAAVTVVAVPIATVISCGDSDSKTMNVKGDLNQGSGGQNTAGRDEVKLDRTNPDGKLGDASVTVQAYAENTPIMDLITNSYDSKHSFNYPQLNLKGAKDNNSANMKNWKEISKYRIYWDKHATNKPTAKEFSGNENFPITSLREFQISLREINQNIKDKIDALDPLHKRTLVFANSEFNSSSSFKQTINQGYFELKIYDTLKDGTSLPKAMTDSINQLVQTSNIKAKTWDDFANLDLKMDAPTDENGKPISSDELLTRQYIRNNFVSDSKANRAYWIGPNVFDGSINNTADKNVKDYVSPNMEKYMENIRKLRRVKNKKDRMTVWTRSYTDFNAESLNIGITYALGGAYGKLPNAGLINREGFENDIVETVFTFNPKIVDLNKATGYYSPSETSIFEDDAALADFITDQLELIIGGSMTTTIQSQVQMMKDGLTALNGFFQNADEVIKKMIDFKTKHSVGGALKPGYVKDLEANVKRAIPDIKKAFKSRVEYGKLLNAVHKKEETQTVDQIASNPNAFEEGKKNTMNIIGMKDDDFRTQFMLYFGPRVLSDFSSILAKHWK